MKSTLFFLILLFPVYLFSQGENDKLIYMDSSSGKTTKENHVYYRIIRDYNLKKDNYKLEEYYKSGKLKQEGVSTEKDVYKYFGIVTSYYENDNVQEKTTYKDAQPEGPYFSYYENGNKKAEGEYFSDSFARRLKINQYWDQNGNQKVIDGFGVYEEVKYKVTQSGPLKNGLKNGVWKGFDKKTNANFTETYKDGDFVSGTSIDENHIERNYTKIDESPEPVNGIRDFYDFIGKNFKTPKNEHISGRIIASFTVDKNGFIKEIKILKGLSEKTDAEALRVLNLYKKKWKSGKSRGIDVDIKYGLPIQVK